MIEQAYHVLLMAAMIVLGILVIVGIIRSVLGPGISDRVIAVNVIGTIIIMLIAILSLYLDESYLVDVCLIYAMISFLGVVVLCKVYTGVYLQRKQIKANLEAVEDNLLHQEESAEATETELSAQEHGGRPSEAEQAAGTELSTQEHGDRPSEAEHDESPDEARQAAEVAGELAGHAGEAAGTKTDAPAQAAAGRRKEDAAW